MFRLPVYNVRSKRDNRAKSRELQPSVQQHQCECDCTRGADVQRPSEVDCTQGRLLHVSGENVLEFPTDL